MGSSSSWSRLFTPSSNASNSAPSTRSTVPGELADGSAHAVRDDGVFGPVHDRRQGAVIVEEYSGAPHVQQPGQFVAVGQRVRQITDVLGHYPLLVSY